MITIKPLDDQGNYLMRAGNAAYVVNSETESAHWKLCLGCQGKGRADGFRCRECRGRCIVSKDTK